MQRYLTKCVVMTGRIKTVSRIINSLTRALNLTYGFIWNYT